MKVKYCRYNRRTLRELIVTTFLMFFVPLSTFYVVYHLDDWGLPIFWAPSQSLVVGAIFSVVMVQVVIIRFIYIAYKEDQVDLKEYEKDKVYKNMKKN